MTRPNTQSNADGELDKIISDICADSSGFYTCEPGSLCKFCLKDKKRLLAYINAREAALLSRVDKEVIGSNGSIMRAKTPEAARQVNIENRLRNRQRTTLDTIKAEIEKQ